MKSTIAAVFIGVGMLLALPSAADACNRSVSKKAAATIVPTGRIDQVLLDQAIRTEVNYHRCRAGLRKVGDAGKGMGREAEKHSTWMAKTQNLKHRNTISGSKTLQQRVQRAGIRNVRTGSENIGMVHRYQVDGLRFRIIDSNACQFATYDGQALGAHSYATLARHIVTLWMNSPGHRKNILDRTVTKTRTSVAFDGVSKYCGRFWLTQNFVG